MSFRGKRVRQKFTVTKGKHSPVLLGNDFGERMNLIIDQGRTEVYFREYIFGKEDQIPDSFCTTVPNGVASVE